MDPISLSAAPQQAAPTLVPDQRPAADAAALARDTTPYVALPATAAPVAGVSQTAAVSRSNVAASADTAQSVEPAQEAQRTLKPYGVTMLPNGKPDIPSTFPEPPQDSPSDPAQDRTKDVT